jgi:hypothetical protein
MGFPLAKQKYTLANLMLAAIDYPKDMALHIQRTLLRTDGGIDLIPANKRLADVAARRNVPGADCRCWSISVWMRIAISAALFSPVYTSTRPYSQTRSNTQRDLMLPDEVLRLDYQKRIALFHGHKPALLYKLTPEELPGYANLRSVLNSNIFSIQRHYVL